MNWIKTKAGFLRGYSILGKGLTIGKPLTGSKIYHLGFLILIYTVNTKKKHKQPFKVVVPDHFLQTPVGPQHKRKWQVQRIVPYRTACCHSFFGEAPPQNITCASHLPNWWVHQFIQKSAIWGQVQKAPAIFLDTPESTLRGKTSQVSFPQIW